MTKYDDDLFRLAVHDKLRQLLKVPFIISISEGDLICTIAGVRACPFTIEITIESFNVSKVCKQILNQYFNELSSQILKHGTIKPFKIYK